MKKILLAMIVLGAFSFAYPFFGAETHSADKVWNFRSSIPVLLDNDTPTAPLDR